MSTPPSTPPNKYVMPRRVADVEKLAANCDTAIRELTARLDRLPPRGDRGETGPAGLSIKGDPGRDGKDGRDGVGRAGRDGMHGTNGKDGTAGPDSTAVLASTRAELANVLAKVEDLCVIVQGLLDANKRGAEYVRFLQEKVRGKQQ